jgi:hypothetical protein
MPTKKKEEVPITNSNINNNTNNVNVNVHVPKPRASRKTPAKKQAKPNWVLKAIVIGLIGLAIAFLGKLTGVFGGGKGSPAVIENRTPTN